MALYDRSVLVTIDVQRDFYESGAPARVEGTAQCIPAMSRVAEAFRSSGLPIVHVVRLYLADGSNAEPVRRPMLASASVARPRTPGSHLPAELLPEGTGQPDPEPLLRGEMQQVGGSEWVMYKPRWGAFYRTGLEEHLRALQVDTVVFVGCNFPNCPRASVYEASERDFATVLVEDAVSGTYARDMQELAGIGTVVTSTDGVLRELREVVLDPAT